MGWGNFKKINKEEEWSDKEEKDGIWWIEGWGKDRRNDWIYKEVWYGRKDKGIRIKKYWCFVLKMRKIFSRVEKWEIWRMINKKVEMNGWKWSGI